MDIDVRRLSATMRLTLGVTQRRLERTGVSAPVRMQDYLDEYR